MATITFPSNLPVGKIMWALQRRDLAYKSIFGSQAVEVSSPVWMVTIESSTMTELKGGAWKAFLLQLKGKINNIALWDMKRPIPLGTMRGAMTLNAQAVSGATTLSIIASGEVSKTLLAGDLLGLGTGTTQQVCMVTTDATSDGSGIISVTVEPALRNTHNAAAAVTWDKPKALFRQTQSKSGWEYSQGSMVSGFSLDLVEDWRA